MHSLQKFMRGLALVGQLGFCIITPPLVLVWLARLLVVKHGWGPWVMVVAIVVGLLCAASSAWGMIRSMNKSGPKTHREPTVHYHDHI